MAAASQGVTRDQLIWIADACNRPETYKAALARIINAHHVLPIAAIWGDGSTSSSDGQFFRSAKRGAAAGEINARYGHDAGFSCYTHLSDQHGPYNIKVISATYHEGPYALDGLLHHGTQLNIGTHTPIPAALRIMSSFSAPCSGSASAHGCATCRTGGWPASSRVNLHESTAAAGQRAKADVVREHWDEAIRLIASLKAGTVAPSIMLKKRSCSTGWEARSGTGAATPG
jgi:TnpA family transposase